MTHISETEENNFFQSIINQAVYLSFIHIRLIKTLTWSWQKNGRHFLM